VAAILGVSLFVFFALGAFVGAMLERKSWLIRAMSSRPHAPNTPHHCNGEFYYIVPEKMFCEEFRRVPPRKPTVGPKGGTGVPPKPCRRCEG
jgi:hypothetical protein